MAPQKACPSTTNLRTSWNANESSQAAGRWAKTGWTATWTCPGRSATSTRSWTARWLKTNNSWSTSLKSSPSTWANATSSSSHATAYKTASQMKSWPSGSTGPWRNSTKANSSRRHGRTRRRARTSSWRRWPTLCTNTSCRSFWTLFALKTPWMLQALTTWLAF